MKTFDNFFFFYSPRYSQLSKERNFRRERRNSLFNEIDYYFKKSREIVYETLKKAYMIFESRNIHPQLVYVKHLKNGGIELGRD